MRTLVGRRFGFLGAGVIADVFVRRLLGSKVAEPENIIAHDINGPILERLALTFKVRGAASHAEVAEAADYLILGKEVPCACTSAFSGSVAHCAGHLPPGGNTPRG
jgi:hypothetical protein